MRIHVLTVMVLLLAVPPVFAQVGAKKLTPCSVVTKAEVQEAVGKMVVADPVPNKTNPTVCDFKVGDYGTVGVMVPPPGTSPDQLLAEMKRSKLAVTDAPGIGDRSFYVSPGFGMAQLNTFKGGNYVIITVIIPGSDETKGREIATKLMQKALARF